MDKIDCLGWAAGVAFVSYGLRVGIRVSSPEIMDRIAGLLPPNAKEARGPRVGCLYSLIVSGTKVGSNTRRFNILYSDWVQLARTKDTDVVLEALERDLQLYVAEQARLDGIPTGEKASPLPRWLVPSVLRQWSIEEHYMDNVPSMAYCFRHPAQLPRAFRLRWPNPIQATVGVGGPFNELPRLPFQLWECVSRAAYFITQIPTLVRQRSLRAVGGSGTGSGTPRRDAKGD
jgi:hypothetical protein